MPLSDLMETRNLKRIALMVWEYRDFTKGPPPPSLIGLNSMAVRHLEQSGYHVLQVDFFAFGTLFLQLGRRRMLELKSRRQNLAAKFDKKSLELKENCKQ